MSRTKVYSKKQKKASRMMMKARKGFHPMRPENDFVMPKINLGVISKIVASMFGSNKNP